MSNKQKDFSLAYTLRWIWYYLTKTTKGRFEVRHCLEVLVFIIICVLFLDVAIYLCHIK